MVPTVALDAGVGTQTDSSADSWLPSLRSDLVIARIRVADAWKFTIKVPDSGNYFRLGEDEMLIAQLLDGQRSVEDVIAQAERRHGIEIEPSILHAFVEQLGAAGCLALPDQQAAAREHKPAVRKPRNPLYVDKHVFNPDALLEWMEPSFRFLFTSTALWVIGGVFAASLMLLWGSRQSFVLEVTAMGTVSGMIILYLAAAVVTALHELAHGLACKHFGGRVPSMGVLLILLLMPCFYTDVSDAWLFERKRHRLLVTAAGVIFESLIWSGATVLWYLTAADSLIHQVCLGVMVSSGLGMLLSLNPLLKFDGYYLLVDLFDIPSLRDKSMGYFSIWLGTLVSGRRDRLPKFSQREHRIFVCYGFGVLLFMFTVLGGALLLISSAAVDKFGPLLLLPLLYLGWRVLGSTFKGIWEGIKMSNTEAKPAPESEVPLTPPGRPVLVSSKRPEHAPVSTAQEEIAKPVTSEPDESSPPPVEGASPPPRQSSGPGFAPILIAVLLMAAVLGHNVNTPLTVSGKALLKPSAYQAIEPSIQGLIQQVYVQEGALVELGDPLLKIDDRNLVAAMKSAEARLVSARKELLLLQKGTPPERLAAKRSELANLLAEVEWSGREFARLRDASGSVSRSQVATARHAWESAQREVTVARNELALLQAGTPIETIEAKQAEIVSQEVQLAKLQRDIEATLVRAPISGQVVTREPEGLVGQFTNEGNAILSIQHVGGFRAQIMVRERDAAQVRPGLPVRLKVYAYPSREFAGEVVHLSTTVEAAVIDNLASSVMLVEAAIDDPDNLLKSGMNGIARIESDQVTWLELAFRKIIYWFKIEFWI